MVDSLDELSTPTVHQLEASLLLGRFLGRAEAIPEADLLDTYRRLPTEGLFDLPALRAAEDVLCGAGLAEHAEGQLLAATELAGVLAAEADAARDEILRRYLAARPPLWLVAAASGTDVDEMLIPDAVMQTLATVLPDSAERREALLLAAGRKFDDHENRETGALAETHVVGEFRSELTSAGRPDLAERVRQVSLVSDQLGYDVTAPRLDGGPRRAEVKGTRTTGPVVEVVLSRNEGDWGQRDPAWALVVCRVDENDVVAILGWMTGSRLAPKLPVDPLLGGKWLSARYSLDIDTDLTAGLPPC